MSETQTLTLSEFLLERITEDEAEVRRAMAERPAVELWTAPLLRAGASEARVLARFGPLRLLAECEAKRRIVEMARARLVGQITADVAPRILAALALPYDDHPDFREEWVSYWG